MPSIAAQLQMARTTLAPVAGEMGGLEARVLAAHAWGMTAETLVKHADEPRDAAAFDALLARRLQHEPVAHIVGTKEFWRDTFLVSRDVLTPRADSETIIETLLRLRPDTQAAYRVLDLGTGSGCLLLSTLREYVNATGLGVDQSPAALSVATHNAQALTLEARSQFMQSDWCSAVTGTYDIVLSNPPYIPYTAIAGLDADVRMHEPHAALDGGPDGLDCYRSILQQVGAYMRPHGLLLFEVGMDQAADVAALGETYKFRVIDQISDLAGITRVVVLEQTSTFSQI